MVRSATPTADVDDELLLACPSPCATRSVIHYFNSIHAIARVVACRTIIM
jgi:hypothetical protein